MIKAIYGDSEEWDVELHPEVEKLVRELTPERIKELREMWEFYGGDPDNPDYDFVTSREAVAGVIACEIENCYTYRDHQGLYGEQATPDNYIFWWNYEGLEEQ